MLCAQELRDQDANCELQRRVLVDESAIAGYYV